MQRFRTTSKGYKFDKVILFGTTLIILIILFSIFSYYGLKFKPYFKCEESEIKENTCLNPFYNPETYSCSYAFGMIKCDIEEYDWMKQSRLPIGEYGKKPMQINNLTFLLIVIIMYAFALYLNHIIWNKGKNFHLDIFDFIERIEDDKE